MNFLTNLKMKNKLGLLLFLPLLTLIILSLNSLYYNYTNIQETYHEDLLTDLIKKVEKVLESLGEEENLSIDFLEEKQESLLKNLKAVQSSTDDLMDNLKEFLDDFKPFTRDKNLVAIWKNLRINLEGLNEKRRIIDQAKLPRIEILNYYDKLINEGFEIINTIVFTENDSYLLHLLQAHFNLFHEFFNASREREIVKQGIKNGQFSQELYQELLFSIQAQADDRQNFDQVATLEQKELLKNKLNHTQAKEAIQTRLLILNKTREEKIDIPLREWLENKTSSITILNEIKASLLEEADKFGTHLIFNAEFNLYMVIAGLSLLLLITCSLSTIIVKSITKPLNEAVTLAENVSQGKLATHRDKIERQDEIGDLERALYRMNTNLQVMLGHLLEEIATLATSSNEMMSSISMASAGTVETATAVTETTTTMEELKQTGQLASEKANDVLHQSEKALVILKNSEKSLNMTIQDMHQIEEKMSTVSQSIIKLTEHSQVIGNIIDIVNDLAEQSHLLAVNAAIEAAKAGDQGKGFAVVAQEIRSLANQSKQAVTQVHHILHDIQNATSEAVMASEQGSKAVHKGVIQSSETNDSIGELSIGINTVTQAASQIAISSGQQLIGVEQVALAMSNIKEASNQHVDHIKQIEMAIKNLYNVGQSLKNIVEQYKF